ncbi:MAG: hypothetical protein AB7K04_06550 [Pseudorhodoplanes sp.]
MADDRYNRPANDPGPDIDPLNAERPDVNRLYGDEANRSSGSLGWILGAIVVVGVLVYAFGWRPDQRTADNVPADNVPPAAVTQQTPGPAARPAPVPGPVGQAPGASSPTRSTTTGTEAAQ